MGPLSRSPQCLKYAHVYTTVREYMGVAARCQTKVTALKVGKLGQARDAAILEERRRGATIIERQLVERQLAAQQEQARREQVGILHNPSQ